MRERPPSSLVQLVATAPQSSRGMMPSARRSARSASVRTPRVSVSLSAGAFGSTTLQRRSTIASMSDSRMRICAASTATAKSANATCVSPSSKVLASGIHPVTARPPRRPRVSNGGRAPGASVVRRAETRVPGTSECSGVETTHPSLRPQSSRIVRPDALVSVPYSPEWLWRPDPNCPGSQALSAVAARKAERATRLVLIMARPWVGTFRGESAAESGDSCLQE